MNLSAQDAALLWADVVDMARGAAPDALPWLERLSPEGMQDGTMLVSTRQNWTARKVMGEFRPTIEALLAEITLEHITLQVTVETAGEPNGDAATASTTPGTASLPAVSVDHTASSPISTAGVDHGNTSTAIPGEGDGQPAGGAYAKGMSPAALAGLEMRARQAAASTASGVFPKPDRTAEDVGRTANDDATPMRGGRVAPDARHNGGVEGLPTSPATPTQDRSNFSAAAAEDPTEPPMTPTEQADATGPRHAGDFTFETYVVGEANEIAYKMARAVAEQPGIVANPLFIYGPSGFGKTHLLLSIVDYIESHTHGAYKTLYVAANTFVEQFVDEIKVKGVRGESVMRRYREVDVLLVDDVQAFVNKQESVTMFFDLFNLLIGQGKQIVLAADRAPDYLELDPRMKTRFGQGLVVDIKAPTYEMKWAILRSFYERSPLRPISGVAIPDEAFGTIARLCPDNPRAMQGLVTSLIPAAAADPQVLTEEGLRAFIGKLHKTSEAIDIAVIARTVGDYYGVDVEALRGAGRTKVVSEARQVVMWLTRQLTNCTYEEIGRYLGHRDHATVCYGIKVIEEKSADQKYSYMLDQLRRSLTE